MARRPDNGRRRQLPTGRVYAIEALADKHIEAIGREDVERGTSRLIPRFVRAGSLTCASGAV